MNNPRVAVACEGTFEAPTGLWRLEPRDTLVHDSHLGPVHVLIGRMISTHMGIPYEAVQFEEPLHVRRRRLLGSELLTAIGKLTRYPPGSAPDALIVVVDEDGDATRVTEMEQHADEASMAVAVGVAVREFESWLLADAATAARVLGAGPPSNVETAEPRVAKNWLQHAVSERNLPPRTRKVLAEQVDLDVLGRTSPSWNRFNSHLRTAIGR